jgi:hypothetical protein
MTASSRAHFLLPTPLGLVHFDLLEDVAFVGPGPRGGLTADPVPFPKAKIAVARVAGGFVVRALPGEPPPEVNGAPGNEARLKDGDRVKIGDQVVLFRAGAPTAAAAVPVPVVVAAPSAPPPAPVAPVAPRVDRESRAAPEPRAGAFAATALSLVGAGLVLVAVYLGVRHLQSAGHAPPSVPAPPRVEAPDASPSRALSREEEKAAKAYAAARAYETEHGEDVEGAVARYRQVLKDFPSQREADQAGSRIAELWPKAATAAWTKTKDDVRQHEAMRRYRSALQAIRLYEAKFAGTEGAAQAPALAEAVRTAARAALDALKERALPLLASDPTRAYGFLYRAELELPPDLEAELGALMARARESWGTGDSPANGSGSSRRPSGSTGPKPPGPSGGPPGTPPPRPVDRETSERHARALWDQAHADLVAKSYEAARKGYDLLLRDYTDTRVVVENVRKIESGHKAADLGWRGPPALLAQESTFRKGRLEVEYQFDDPRILASDFTVEQPFPNEEGALAQVKNGMAVLSGSTAILLNVVFEPDATWEAECYSDEPRDFGLLAFQEGKEYRVFGWEAGNTQLRFKKGGKGTIPAGHALFLFGDGVWRDADPTERGWVRIGLREGNRLRAGEPIRMKLEVRGDKASAELHAKADAANLSGAIKGDDGRGIGAFRVGAFAFTSVMGVERLTVSGKVDMAWFDAQVAEFAKGDPGPE